MPRRRLKEVVALTVLHSAGMSKSLRHAGKPGLSAASLCGKGHETGGSLREERIETRLNIVVSSIDTQKYKGGVLEYVIF